MSKAIARQRVKFYKDSAKNEVLKGKIKLYNNKLVINNANKTKIPINFTPSTSIFVSHQSTGFHIHQSEDVSFTIFTDENLQLQWVKLINFYLLCYLIGERHVHPLTLTECGQGICEACSTVIHNRVDQRSFSCEFCPESIVLCYECYRRVDSMLNRAVKSHSHKHMLYSFDEAPVKKLKQENFTCSKCKEVCSDDPFQRTTYHCLQCLDYVECSQCFNVPNICGVHSTLDLKHFDKYLIVDPLGQEISIKPNVMIPSNISLITEGYWDLSQISRQPVDNAYFEIEFLSFNPDAVVGIGIGNEIFNSHALLGNQQNSFAYYNNGEIRKNLYTEQNASEYHQGDVVGCGILLDNYSQRQVYFTLNGKLLDKRVMVHDGMNCYPGVCFTKESGVHFKTNFKGPFKFDPKLVPNYRNDRVNYFDLLPPEVMQQFIQFTARTPLAVFSQLQLVCKNWRDLTSDNSLWRDVFIHRWPHQNPRVKIQDWKKFYRKRKQALLETAHKPSQPIENCEFDFQCPLIWQKLKGTEKLGVSYCNTCNKEVYAVHSQKTLQTYVQMGRCVVFNPIPVNLPTPPPVLDFASLGGKIVIHRFEDDDPEEDWSDWD